MIDPHKDQSASEAIANRLFGGAVETGWWREIPASMLEEVLAGINASRQRQRPVDRRDDLGNAMTKIRNALIQRHESQERREEPHSETKQNLGVIEADMTSTDPEGFFDAVFDHPSHRLAVYGSLKPGFSNAAQLACIEGDWRDGTVHGIVVQPGKYLEFTWDVSAPPVSVMVFSSPRLNEHFNRLDEFEGPDYQRTLVPVAINGLIHVCNIYEGKQRKKRHA